MQTAKCVKQELRTDVTMTYLDAVQVFNDDAFIQRRIIKQSASLLLKYPHRLYHLGRSTHAVCYTCTYTTKCIKRIRDLFEYALYKFTLYLLTYLLTRLVVALPLEATVPVTARHSQGPP